MTHSNSPDGEQERALDAALSRTLTPPRAPPQLRERLRAAIARGEGAQIADMRLRFEREQRQRLAELREEYVWMRRGTLGMMVGGAFTAGAIAAITIPWLTANLGPVAPVIVASGGTAVGLWIGISSWLAARKDYPA
jgi:hypothetical protein